METKNRLIEWIPENESSKGLRSLHLWIIVGLYVLLTFIYYIDQIPFSGYLPLRHSVWTSVHDLHRSLLLIPLIYVALIYRIKGSLIASSAFLAIVLPRAIYFSPFPHPLVRPLLAVFFSTAIGLLVALWLNRFEKERKARAELTVAHQALQDANRRLQENQAMLVQAEKLASMGQLAASICHEVNNPLSGVLIHAQILIQKIKKNEVEKDLFFDYLSTMEFELTRSTKLIRNLLDFGRQSEPKMKKIDVNEVLNRALDVTFLAGSGENTQLDKELGSLPELLADPDQLQQVLVNLMMNAFQAMPNGGRLTLRTSVENHEVHIAIQDTGFGIPPENIRRLFTPFSSTKSEVKGVGLGLAVSYGIIKRHGGRIEVKSEVGIGSTFTVCLPILGENEAGA